MFINIGINNTYNLIRTNVIKKINLLFIFPIIGNHGPATLAKSYIKTIKYLSSDVDISKYFTFEIKSHVSFQYYINYANKSNNIIWFLFSDYFKELLNNNYLQIYKNTIYGPMVSPRKWLQFPQNGTYEVYWSSCINKILAYVVQSERVKNHLLKHSTTFYKIQTKYIVSHGCLIPNNSYSVLSWSKRSIDILIYAKFADINKEIELHSLIKYLLLNFTIKLIRYGNHTKNSLIYYSNNSKILIYFSYFDCWPSSLMEMENLGVYPIVHQCELIEKYGTCINNISNNFHNLIYVIKSILNGNFNSNDISYFYRNRNNCLNVFKSTLLKIYKHKISDN